MSRPLGDDRRRRGWSDPRLMAYVAATFLSLVAAVVAGRHELVATGVPFALLAALGLADPRPPAVRGQVVLHTPRLLEGDELVGAIVLDWDGHAELDVMLVGYRGVEPHDPAPVVGWALPAGRGPLTLPFRMQTLVWGRHHLGQLWVRARRPQGLRCWEDEVASGPEVRVLPVPLRLDRLLRPAEPRAVAGAHLARLTGTGTDFAELRPYAPGDRLRDLSWPTFARLGEPWVKVHHPERTGTVLLLLDAFYEQDTSSTEGLARAARAAWSVAAAHLRVQDRVGLLAVGRTTAWMPPQGGRRARWLLLDELLSVGAAAEDWRQRRWRLRADVPADALVVGITTLRSRTFAQDLLHYRRAGHTTGAVVVETDDLLPPPQHRVDCAARRMWLAGREAERHVLHRAGVPTAVIGADGSMARVISVLREATSRQRSGRAA